MKSEPDVYSIDDLAKESKPALWEGCRSYTVRNFFRDTMKSGDLAFFYNSNSKPSGIAGTMKIVGDAFPDPTQFDPRSRYFDAKSPKDQPRWLARNVQFIKKFRRVISLDDLRQVPGLEEMLVIRKGQRLSVLPVTEKEWKIINDLPGL